ncbi:hypothetical protein, partial [Paenibacillus campinasensis]|uniref:hypothetical protein n=1 Tax=Paenibacillus campinasensis TaxID=66347 RepID=UPI001E39BA02
LLKVAGIRLATFFQTQGRKKVGRRNGSLLVQPFYFRDLLDSPFFAVCFLFDKDFRIDLSAAA